MKAISIQRKRRATASLHPGVLALGLTVLMTGLECRMALAQVSVSSSAYVGADQGFGIAAFDQQSASDNSVVTANATHSFSGLNRAGDPRTMTFTGTTIASSDYGRLHCMTSGRLVNSYYNSANQPYADLNGNVINPLGTPTSMDALGFAVFNDTLQYGGALQAGYKARYIFHVDGINSGLGALADLGVTVDANPGDLFFSTTSGPFTADWVTKDYDINGITPQHINVQFSDQVALTPADFTDGQTYTGTSDFGSTLTLTGVQVVDAGGTPVSGWTVTSGSGTNYPLAVSTPEPGVIALLMGLGVPASLLALRRRRAA